MKVHILQHNESVFKILNLYFVRGKVQPCILNDKILQNNQLISHIIFVASYNKVLVNNLCICVTSEVEQIKVRNKSL